MPVRQWVISVPKRLRCFLANRPEAVATFTATLDEAIIPLQVDVGFGDAITPAAENREYSVLVGMAAPKLRIYPVETVSAEILEAAVKLGMVNSRMKDFYELLVIFRRFRFDDGTLARVIEETFARRGAPLPRTVPQMDSPVNGTLATVSGLTDCS